MTGRVTVDRADLETLLNRYTAMPVLLANRLRAALAPEPDDDPEDPAFWEGWGPACPVCGSRGLKPCSDGTINGEPQPRADHPDRYERVPEGGRALTAEQVETARRFAVEGLERTGIRRTPNDTTAFRALLDALGADR